MRIVAGRFGGRRIARPADRRVRVTTDRVREAWFAILDPMLSDARVLDLFAGSGVLGLEALSRGARSVDFVELSTPCLETIRSNITTLGVVDRTRVHRADALRYATRIAHGSFDIALADPPYTTDQATRLVERYRTRPFAELLAVEHRAKLDCGGDETRRYGDVAVSFFRAS